jgi:hypothetical protein
MAALPQLSPKAVTVLRLTLDNKMIRGGELMRYAGMSTPSELTEPVNELLSQELIQVSGDISEEMIPFATFGTRPSDYQFLRFLLDQPQKR